MEMAMAEKTMNIYKVEFYLDDGMTTLKRMEQMVTASTEDKAVEAIKTFYDNKAVIELCWFMCEA